MLPICVIGVTMLRGGASLRRIVVNTKILGGLAMALGLIASAVPVFAHHSFAAEFDGTKQIETGAPNVLYRQGWRKDDLKTGDTVTPTAFLAKDGSHTAAAPSSTPDQK
jgi:hypothetical protein